MSYHSHTAAEWAAFVSLGVSVWAAGSALVLLICDADPEDFDPRPALARAVESGRVDGLLVTVANAKYDARAAVAPARLALRDAAISLAALLALLFPAHGGTR